MQNKMAKIAIDRERCKGCLLCVSFCPKGCICVEEKLNVKGIKPVRFKEGAGCLGCLRCALVCPDCCIEVYK